MSLSKDGTENLKNILLKINPSMKDKFKEIDIKSYYLYGNEKLTFFDTFNPALIGFFVFFFVFLIAGISILKERTTKTLEKLLSTSIKRYEILLGYLLGYGIFAVILTNLLIAFVALSLGIFLSTFANSEFQMIQFIPIVIVPQIFFTGLIQVETISPILQKIAHFIPLYYGSSIMSDIMIKGATISEVYVRMLILLFFATLIYLLNLLGLKKYRTL